MLGVDVITVLAAGIDVDGAVVLEVDLVVVPVVVVEVVVVDVVVEVVVDVVVVEVVVVAPQSLPCQPCLQTQTPVSGWQPRLPSSLHCTRG